MLPCHGYRHESVVEVYCHSCGQYLNVVTVFESVAKGICNDERDHDASYYYIFNSY